MKKTLTYIHTYILVVFVLVFCGSAKAQNLSSAYFADGYAFGHQLNPAKAYDRKGYFSMPLLSNLNVGIKGNLEMRDFFKKLPNGKMATILHPDFSYDEAMSGLSNNNKLLMDMRMDILSFGFGAFKGYNTVTLSTRIGFGFNVPKEFFGLVKSIENRNYNFSDMGMKMSAYAELGLGHSRQINDAWRVGGKLKLLVGAGYAKMNLDDVKMDLSNEDQWTVSADASAEIGVKGFTWGEKDNDGEIDFDNIDVKDPGIGGFGAALDLGAEWDLGKQGWVDGLKVSAAVLDLGFIKWNNVAIARNNGEDVVFNGFEGIKVDDGDGTDFDDLLDEKGEEFEKLLNMEAVDGSSKARMLGATLNIGVEYALPMYKKLSFGLLSTTHIQGQYTWNEERLSFTLSPAKAFEISANVGVGTFGANVGWLVNFHPRGFSLFVGSDHCLGKIMKPAIPMRSSYNINMGIVFPIGKSKI